jgi:hypothetical protein
MAGRGTQRLNYFVSADNERRESGSCRQHDSEISGLIFPRRRASSAPPVLAPHAKTAKAGVGCVS